MKSIVFRGPIITKSGYGVHAMQIVKYLFSRGYDPKFLVTPWGDTSWHLNANNCDGLVGKVMQSTTSDTTGFDVSLQLQLPNEWDPKIARFNVGITAAVETDRCNPAWVSACNTMDLIIVPSTFTKQVLESSGKVDRPIIVVPESYNEKITEQASLESTLDFSTPFNFLVLGQLTGFNALNDRKNTFNALKLLCEVFKDDKDVGIVLKTNSGRNSRIDRKNTLSLVKSVLKEVRQGPYPLVHLLHGDMSDEEIAALYKHKKIKALLALTRGEGFGLPILEAATSGLPVIATGWSGHLDFMRKGKFIEIAYALQEIHESRIDNNIFMKGSRWANPVEEDAKKKILKFRNSSQIPTKWASDLSKILIETHKHDTICKAYDDALVGALKE